MLLKYIKGIFGDYHGHLWYAASALKNMNVKPHLFCAWGSTSNRLLNS